jgi:hypothetical protein
MYWRTIWQKNDYVVFMFNEALKERHLAASKEVFDLLVADGENAVKAGDIDELRTIVRRYGATRSERKVSRVTSVSSPRCFEVRLRPRLPMLSRNSHFFDASRRPQFIDQRLLAGMVCCGR